MAPSRRTALLLWFAANLSLALLAAARWPDAAWLTTGFDSLLPASEQTEWLAEANRAVSASLSDKLIVLVRGSDQGAVDTFQAHVATQLSDAGYAVPDFEAEQVRRWAALARALHPFRANLVTDEDRARLETDPAQFLTDYRRMLFSPLGGPLLNVLRSDPMGLFRDYLQSAAPQPPRLAPSGNEARGAANAAIYVIHPQRLEFRALAGLWNVYLHLREEAAAEALELHATGAPLYSAYGVFSAQREISTVGAASLALLITLLLLVLRSPSALLLVLTCVAAGVSWGLLATVALLQQIHVLTLVFGVTLIGISADYAFHYLTHSLLPDWTPERSLRRVWRSLTLGLISSVLAFMLLVFLPFPGLRQIGLFMGAGLIGSYLTVCLLLPAIYRGTGGRDHLPAWANGRGIDPGTGRWLLSLALLVAIPGLWLLNGRDDVRDFYAAPESLQEADRALRDTMHGRASGRYFLLRADDPQSLLALEERLIAAASQRQGTDEVDGFVGMTRLVPSTQMQRRNFDVVRQLVAEGLLADHLDRLGLSREDQEAILAEWRAITEESAFQAIDPASIAALDLPAGTGGMLGCGDSGCGGWVRLTGGGNVDELDQLAKSIPGVLLVDPVGDVNALMQRNRVAVSGLLLLGILLAALFLTVTTGWRRALHIVSLPVLASLLTLAAVGYGGGGYSIVHVLALLLVIGVSLDFAIFRVFTAPDHQPATTLAIALSALTSILAFGMLGFSRTPLIADFGMTIATGLLIAWGLSWIRLEPTSGRAHVE